MAKLLDQYGNPIDLRRLREEEAGPTVTGVRQILTGHPADGLTPMRLGRLLRAAEEGDATAYLELAEQMEEKDLHYRSVLPTRKYQVAGLEITVEAASDDKDDVAAADLVREFLWRDTLQEELFDVLDAIGKGFSVTEILWDTDAGGRWMPSRLEWRDPRWFEFSREDGRTLMLRGAGGQPEPLKPYGYIVHVHKSKSGLPIRGGLARPVAWLYLFKNFDIRSWVQFAESYGRPMRLGKYGPGAGEREKATLLAAVRNVMSDAAAIIPDSMAMEFIEAKITGNVDLFERFASWIDKQISKAVLGQTGTTDVGQHTGTADAHERVREDIEKADAGQLAATLNRDLVRPIVDLNMGPRRRYPRIRIDRPDQEDTRALVDNVVRLVPFGLRVERSWISDRLGIPDPDPQAELLAAPATSVDPESTAAHAQQPARDRDAIERLTEEELAEHWEEVMDPVRAAIQQLLDECDTAEEFLARLPELAAKLPVDQLSEALGRALFAARAAGELGDDIG
jgi:phage gp29-like protein